MASQGAESRPTSMVSPRHVRSRTQSFSSDRPSTISHGLLAPPLSVSPEAAFIAATAAAQIVTNDHDNHAGTWYDQNGVEPAGETPLVSSAALQLVNGFLDQLLFNFLQVAKSTTLSALRPAVSEVLKPKLAKDTIRNADEELREYLGDADEDDYIDAQSPNARDWDVELVWKRTRLRCMVYSSLGDLEEEDEDMYMEQENLEIGANERISDVISPAVAIFLTSVLEHMGELTLTVAGQAAHQRVRAKIEKDIREGTRNPAHLADRTIVDEMDMERVALDRTLGRLWRGWKKRMRTPEAVGRPSFMCHSRRNSQAPESHGHQTTVNEEAHDVKKVQDHVQDTIVEDVEPMNIPLPVGDNDVAEIEVPGLARHSDDEDEPEEEEPVTRRPKSFPVTSFTLSYRPQTATLVRPHPAFVAGHRRSHSLPTAKIVFFSRSRSNTNTGVAEADDAEDGSAKQGAVEGVKAQAIAKARKTTPKNGRKDDPDWESDTVDEVATYEKAEILTSSRVSISSSSSRSVSASGRGTHRRSSSVQSARIVDVPAPRSPGGSRPSSRPSSSLDTADRQRPVSISSPSALVQSFSAEEPRKAKAVDHSPWTGQAVAAMPRSPVDRARPALHNAIPISESEEEVDDRSAKTGGVTRTVLPSRTRDQPGHVSPGLQSNFRQTERTLSSPKAEKVSSNTKVTVLKGSNSTAAFVDEQLPEVPRKSPGHSNWQNPKCDGKGLPAVERTKSKDTEEEVALPLHSVVPPRPIHTSGSSGSSATGRLKALRTSEDSSTRAESVARNFEELIQSNQTITYTLTPENMRDIDPPLESPVMTKFTRKNEEARGSLSEVNGSPSGQRAAPSVPQSPVENKAPKPTGPIPRAPAGMTAQAGRVGGPLAREARIAGDSMADFAEFIKSTGPPGDKGPPSLRSVQVSSSPSKRSLDSRRVSITSSRSNRARYQPREAAVDQRADNSDLIDFIRQGPPGSSSGQHRIPRHVAPFRNTMDSDVMSCAVGGKAVDAVIPEIRYSQASTNFTETSMPSIQSSINSSTALLKNKGPSKASKIFGEDGMPVRKTRRVRDPYAIDFSDEEEEDGDFETSARAPAKKEESLAEFLRNYEPPPEPPSAPSSKKVPKKKTSAPSLVGRFTRSGGQTAATEARSLNSSTSNTGFAGNDTRSLNGRSKHIPIQVNMPSDYDMYGSVNSQVTTPSARSVNKVPMRKFEPRDPVGSSQTSDLAAFLRDSAPPPDRALPQTPAHTEETNGFPKMFGRRKKAGVA